MSGGSGASARTFWGVVKCFYGAFRCCMSGFCVMFAGPGTSRHPPVRDPSSFAEGSDLRRSLGDGAKRDPITAKNKKMLHVVTRYTPCSVKNMKKDISRFLLQRQ